MRRTRAPAGAMARDGALGAALRALVDAFPELEECEALDDERAARVAVEGVSDQARGIGTTCTRACVESWRR